MHLIVVGLAASVATFVLSGCNDPTSSSHIAANTPEGVEFNLILARDLNAYAQRSRGNAIEARYELLRKGPTQSGVAFPKYYAWVELLNESREVVESGAARLAAIDRAHFEITHFVSGNEIRSDPAVLRSVFPEALCGAIEARAGVN